MRIGRCIIRDINHHSSKGSQFMNTHTSRSNLALALVFVFVFSLFGSFPTASAANSYSTSSPAAAKVVTDRDPLNIRSGAGTNYKVVSQAKKGSYLQVIGSSGSFYKVVYNANGKTGYASKSYLDIVSTGTAKVTTATNPIVLRSKASTSGKNLDQIPKGSVVPTLGKTGNWYKVVYRNQLGFCSASYLTPINKTQSTKKTTITFSSISNPGTITKGNGVHISGTIKSSNSKLSSITASIRNSSGKSVVSKTVKPNAYSYSIYNSALDWAMTLGSLSTGSYTLRYDVKTADGTRNSISKSFTVKAKSTQSTSASSVPSKNIFVYQGAGSSYCTAASAAMLVRANLDLQGKSYSSITLNTVKKAGWVSGAGLKLDFWVGSSHLKAYSLNGSASEKQKKVDSLLKSHPEGIVLYGWKDSGAQHAIYMANNKKIIDPWYNTASYRNLSQSASSASDNWSTIKQYWIIVN